MHQSATEIPNYSKWAVATNNDMFASIDQEDSRFWVIHVPKLKSEYDPEFKNKLRAEIPYWIGFLKKRWEIRMSGDASGLLKMQNPYPKDRLWLMEEQYCTDALIELKRKSIPITAKNLLDALIEWFDKYNDYCSDHNKEGVYEIRANVTQVKEALFAKDHSMNSTVLKNAMEKYLNLVPSKESLGYKNYLGFDFSVGFVAATPFVNRRNAYQLDYYDLVYKRDGVRINRDRDYKQGDLFKK